MVANPIQAPRQGRDPASVMPRSIRIGLDPILTLAAIGLCVASLVTLGGISHAQMVRQGGYVGVGLVVMVVLSRFDYSRLRELKWGLYVILIASILVVLAIGTSIGGLSTRSIGISVFSFQARSSARSC
jgi:rod shape determining protein RodA